MRVGFLGLGIMGSGMAANLARAGFDVTVWNRTPDKCAPIVGLGARQAATPREVVAQSDITFAMLSDPAAAEEVCLGPGGAIEAVTSGKGYVECSTIAPDTCIKIGAAIAAKGGRFLEAPVSGSRKPAEDGTLVFLAAGDKTLFDDAQPALSKMGRKSIYLGETGSGAKMKLVNNLVIGGMMAVFCEGIALSEGIGLKLDDFLDVLDSGIMANPLFKMKGPLVGNGDFAPAFPLKHMQKDFRLIAGLAEAAVVPLHVTAAVNETFKRAKSEGYGNEDFSAIYKAIKP